MKFSDALKTAYGGVTAAKMRSALTMLGIVIGIASVMLLMSIGNSAKLLIISQVQGVGSNLIFIMPGGTGGSKFASPASTQGIVIKTLVQADLVALQAEPVVKRISPELRGQAKIVFENTDENVTYQGVGADYFGIRNYEAQRGAFFTASDDTSLNRVVVLGSEITKTLFGERDPIGKFIRVKNLNFRVIGVMKPEGVGPFGVDQDNLILIPATVAQKQLLGIDHLNALTIEASSAYTIDYVKQRIKQVLMRTHRITDPEKIDFTLRTQEDALALLGNVTGVLTAFLTSIACISLVVGGIGIMNIMLVSVVERTKEIGLRKALGAKHRDIMLQFLIEAMLLTTTGGIIGMSLGAGLSFLISVVLAKFVSPDWVFTLPTSAVILSASVSAITGIVFGLYPARQAALKSPVEALRYE